MNRRRRLAIFGRVFGLAVGFLGALLTLALIDRIGSTPAGEPLERIVGRPNFERFCVDLSMNLVEIGEQTDKLRCSGTKNGFFNLHSINADEVCAAQFGTGAFGRTLDGTTEGWRCLDTR